MSYLKVITPTNLATEKERFFSDKNYSPQLEYNWDQQTLDKFLEDSPNGTTLVDALLSQNGTDITSAAMQFFDVQFRPEDITFAQELIANTPTPLNHTAEEYAALMQRRLTELGIDYTVQIVDQHGFQGRPNHKKHLMKISKYAHLQYLSLEGIVNHELTHIIRAVNGAYNQIPNSSNYLPTEEGLACLIQDNLLAQPTSSSFQHALEYLAADLSRKAGFREVYQFLLEHGSDPENAWLRGIRQKFGLRDTSRPGGLVKSGMYFYHENILRGRSKDELMRLFVGKIALDELPEYPEYVGKVPYETLYQAFFAV